MIINWPDNVTAQLTNQKPSPLPPPAILHLSFNGVLLCLRFLRSLSSCGLWFGRTLQQLRQTMWSTIAAPGCRRDLSELCCRCHVCALELYAGFRSESFIRIVCRATTATQCNSGVLNFILIKDASSFTRCLGCLTPII